MGLPSSSYFPTLISLLLGESRLVLLTGKLWRRMEGSNLMKTEVSNERKLYYWEKKTISEGILLNRSEAKGRPPSRAIS